jgi:hypothetical protein
MKLQVIDCNDCPFNTNGGHNGKLKYCSAHQKIIPNEIESFGQIEQVPDWCLLKLEKITVEMV